MYYDMKTPHQSAEDAVRFINRASAIVQCLIKGHPATIRTSQTEKAARVLGGLNDVVTALKILAEDIPPLLDEPAETGSGNPQTVAQQEN